MARTAMTLKARSPLAGQDGRGLMAMPVILRPRMAAPATGG